MQGRMEDRSLTALDRLLAGIDGIVRGIAAPPPIAARPYPAEHVTDAPLTAKERRRAAALMRVNHAGEVAAQGLYEGHAAVARRPETAAHMRAAADEERDHLAWCERRLSELEASPSLLRPFWFAGAWLIGAASGVLGDRWSLGFVAETERQVEEHLSGHLDRLPPGDRRSRAILDKMREEERAHGTQATRAGGRELPWPVRQAMRASAWVMKRTAPRL
ncbi:MAG TPA: 2-polyprenyl-3-methyl-6-methoxy-1,4-benzoquinone monooxygenase [Woeseiaceae bacterium]|nr:2-polyprenyl-3-methyl-6-methoxy-1,4-benzoquinone monooxygenase [Woeseiaceae bacterium]